jgi:hypothetical protein
MGGRRSNFPNSESSYLEEHRDFQIFSSVLSVGSVVKAVCLPVLGDLGDLGG